MPQKVDAVAVEIPDGTEGDEIRRFNHKLVCMSSGRLGIMRADKLRAATLCGPHTNFALRIAVDGKISIQKIQEREPGLHDAIVNGLPWRVITKAVALRFPQLPPLIQQCGAASVDKGEGELQILRRLHSLVTQEKKDGLTPDYQRIKKRALASRCEISSPFVPVHAEVCRWQRRQFLGGNGAVLPSSWLFHKKPGPCLVGSLGCRWPNRPTCLGLSRFHQIGMGERHWHGLRHQKMPALQRVCKEAGDSQPHHVRDKRPRRPSWPALGRGWQGRCCAWVHPHAMAPFVLNAKIPGESPHDSLEGIAHDFVPWNVCMLVKLVMLTCTLVKLIRMQQGPVMSCSLLDVFNIYI